MSRSIPRRLSAALATALAGAFLLAACGGDDGDSTTDTTQGTPLSQEEFIAQADAICKAGDEAIQEETAELGNNPSQEEVEQAVSDTVVPNIEDQLNQIDELGAPEGDQEQVDAIVSAARDAVAEVEADPSLITSGDDPFAEANQLAQDYGLTACGDG